MTTRRNATTASGSAKTTAPTVKETADNGILQGIHRDVKALYDAGLVTKTTMRHFDETCLAPVPEMEPVQIITLRRQLGVSQGVFSLYLNVSNDTLSKWEQGKKKPNGAALKLLDIVRRNGLEALA